jgi:uroporphyrinogen III methyltransferase/synthase
MITVASRPSTLAQRQTDELCALLPDVFFHKITRETFGDVHQEICLHTNTKEDIFTDALDECVAHGMADMAVHSAKDVPLPLRAELAIVALTRAADPTDALVSAHHHALADLPSGACVGTSSVQRAAHLRMLRPDLQPVSLRGSIEQRLAQVDAGAVDAIIVATCALQRLGLAQRIAQILPWATHPLQGRLAVVARRDRADVKVLCCAIDDRRTWGKVWIVGAGPGDPELLTRKAHGVLSRADLIFYDALVNADALNAYRGEKVCVGKRKNKHAHTQDAIHEMLYCAALNGATVVRLKGGDPFIFGRGGEECRYLRERLIAVEVIPGISAAQAAAAAWQLPLTDRTCAHHVTFRSAHKDIQLADTAAATGTTVFYMGTSALNTIADALAQQHMSAPAPVAVLSQISTCDEHGSITTRDQLMHQSATAPAIVIAGTAVASATPPRRFLFTGLDPWAVRCAGTLVAYPLIEPVALLMPDIRMADYDAAVFTSKTAARLFCARHGTPVCSVYAIGPATCAELLAHGVAACIQPASADSDALAARICRDPVRRAVYPCSALANNAVRALPNVQALPIYTTRFLTPPRVDLAEYCGIVLTSPSTVAAFFALYPAMPASLPCYVLGQPTRRALIEYGVDVGRIITVRNGEMII